MRFDTVVSEPIGFTEAIVEAAMAIERVGGPMTRAASSVLQIA